jgi:hypothetical protein
MTAERVTLCSLYSETAYDRRSTAVTGGVACVLPSNVEVQSGVDGLSCRGLGVPPDLRPPEGQLGHSQQRAVPRSEGGEQRPDLAVSARRILIAEAQAAPRFGCSACQAWNARVAR